MLNGTGEIQPVVRDAWVQPELNRKDVQVIAPVGKAAGKTSGKVADEKGRDREDMPSRGSHPEDSQVASQLEEFISENMNVQLKIQISESGETIVQLIDKETGDIIRRIPPEKMRQFQSKLEELRGILFDDTV